MSDLDPTLWQRVSAAFDAVHAAGAETRPALLARLAAEDAEVHREVEALLATRTGDTGLLRAATEREAAEWARADDAGAPQAIGAWRLLTRIGRGGMGDVWLAERADGAFEQRVALKLLKRGLDSEELMARFLRERRILARLTHPGIARLIEGGLAPDGRPYFVMEHVVGQCLGDYARAHSLDVAALARLFLQVCAAVEAAHRALVVHRDLKPSNVLVDADGHVKLLDFGIAKLLDPDEDGQRTRAELRPLTPAYAAPEQITGGDITTATDVFALGVLLYELIVGRRPFERSGQTPAELCGALETERCVPPSRALRTQAADAVSAAERAQLERTRRAVAGDLDAVIRKALEADPALRYPTVSALVEDLERHLAGRPVGARAGTRLYRARKFAARHAAALGATALVVAALVSGLTAAAWQARRAGREARRAAEVQRVLIELFEGADPTRTLGRSLPARAVLDEGVRRVERDLRAQPDVRAELEDALAQIYKNLGLLDEALPLATRAAEALRGLRGADDPRTALAEVTLAEILAERGRPRAAEAHLLAALPRVERGLGNDALETLRARGALADVLQAEGRAQEALALHRAVFEATARQLGHGHVQTALRLGDLAGNLADLSRYDETESCLRDALQRLDRAGAARSPQAVVLETELADVLDIVGRDEEAARRFDSALRLGRDVLGPRHPQVAQILLKQGSLLVEHHRTVEADRALVEAVSILEPLGHYDVGAGLRYLGFNALAQERYGEAEQRFARAEAFLRDKLGADHPLTWSAAASRAWAQARAGAAAAAVPRLEQALPAIERLHGPQSREVASLCKYLGEALRLAGRPAEAVALHRRTLALELQLYGGDQKLGVAVTRSQLALDLVQQGDRSALPEARRLADQALAFVRAQDDDGSRLAEALRASAAVAAAQGQRARARRELGEALRRLRAVRPPESPSLRATAAAWRALGG